MKCRDERFEATHPDPPPARRGLHARRAHHRDARRHDARHGGRRRDERVLRTSTVTSSRFDESADALVAASYLSGDMQSAAYVDRDCVRCRIRRDQTALAPEHGQLHGRLLRVHGRRHRHPADVLVDRDGGLGTDTHPKAVGDPIGEVRRRDLCGRERAAQDRDEREGEERVLLRPRRCSRRRRQVRGRARCRAAVGPSSLSAATRTRSRSRAEGHRSP